MTLRRLLWCCFALWLCLLAHDRAAVASRLRVSGSTHVYLMRGIFDVSVGLDALAVELQRRGIAASVYSHGASGTVAAEAIGDYRSGKVRTIILIGHSLGGGAVYAVADALNAAHVPVVLIISLESISGGPAPANVRRVVNFYIAGSGAVVTAGPGFRGSLQNIDVSHVPGMDHMTIQSMPMMHGRMIGYVAAARGG